MDCKQIVAVDPYSIIKADNNPERQGRPIKFMCTGCANNYDFNTIDILKK